MLISFIIQHIVNFLLQNILSVNIQKRFWCIHVSLDLNFLAKKLRFNWELIIILTNNRLLFVAFLKPYFVFIVLLDEVIILVNSIKFLRLDRMVSF